MKNRVNAGPLPKITVVDMCKEVYNGNNGLFSALLSEKLDACMARGDQAIIFINRAGMWPSAPTATFRLSITRTKTFLNATIAETVTVCWTFALIAAAKA